MVNIMGVLFHPLGGDVLPEAGHGYEVVKVFNNNVLLAKHHGAEKILIKKGLGFGRRTGDRIDEATVFDKIFGMESHETSAKFDQLMEAVDPDLIGLCEEVLCMISTEIDDPVNAETHIRLIDHIAFTIYRLRRNDQIENPFIVEIETLYSREYAIARKAVAMLSEALKLEIPESEIGFIALHIHSLRNNGKLSNTIKCASICNSALELIESELRLSIDRKSIDYVRFISHIRFAVERITKNIPIRNDLLSSIKRTYKASYKLAQGISGLMAEELRLKVPDAETGYIALHIERLKNVATGLTNI